MRIPALAATALILGGCQAGYYGHLLRGHCDLLSRREPVERLLADAGVSEALKARLRVAKEARAFASQALALPANDSYTEFADLGRPYAVWNVYAAPELSLEPHQWCYALVGCLAYRGYYREPLAREEAGRLRAQGLDTHVAGVAAYSTLGWFDDPLLNTMLHWSDDVLAGTLFHELAHQRLFADGDTAFNESFATFVEQEGLRQYLRRFPEQAAAAAQRRERRERFTALMLEARRRLEALYAGPAPQAQKRLGKAAEWSRLREAYAALRAEWGGDPTYDGWIGEEPNHARLLPFGLYHAWVGAFEAMFRRVNGDWEAFYRAAAAVAALPPEERRRRLEVVQIPE